MIMQLTLEKVDLFFQVVDCGILSALTGSQTVDLIVRRVKSAACTTKIITGARKV